MVVEKYVGESVDWIHLAQDKDQWRAVGYRTTNLLVP